MKEQKGRYKKKKNRSAHYKREKNAQTQEHKENKDSQKQVQAARVETSYTFSHFIP